jgi:hypothetical protein
MPMEVGVVLGATDAGVVVPMVRLRAVVENLTPSVSPDVPPMVARCQSMLATHLFIGLSDGCFVSMFSPPSWAADAVGACTNIHTFPVLAGDEGRDDLMLSAPVPLGDRPRGVPVTLGEMLEAAEPAIDAAIYPSEA